MEEKKEEIKEIKQKDSNKKKKVLIILGIILVVIAIILFWWFNHKFDVTIKYNNNSDNKEIKVKYLKKVNKKYLKEDIKYKEHTFIGYFETYKLKNKNDKCKKGFKKNEDKTKCISKEEYDINTKIKENKTVEALWSTIIFEIDPKEKNINEEETFNISVTLSGTDDKSVKWSSKDKEVATVDDNGKVLGVKMGKTTIIAESNGIKKKCSVTVNKVEEEKEEVKETPKEEPKDEGTISLSVNNQCIIGNNDIVTITATLNNAIDKTVNWGLPKCYTVEKISDTVIKINRTGRGTQCRSEEERSFTVTARLNNGNSNSLTFTYEPTLEVSVNSNNGANGVQPSSSGVYHGLDLVVKTNVSATFSIPNPGDYGIDPISSTSDSSVTLKNGFSDLSVNIKTTCGQSKTVVVNNNIN